jgi:hypothetical protein
MLVTKPFMTSKKARPKMVTLPVRTVRIISIRANLPDIIHRNDPNGPAGFEPPELAGRWGCPMVRITREPLEPQCSIRPD